MNLAHLIARVLGNTHQTSPTYLSLLPYLGVVVGGGWFFRCALEAVRLAMSCPDIRSAIMEGIIESNVCVVITRRVGLDARSSQHLSLWRKSPGFARGS